MIFLSTAFMSEFLFFGIYVRIIFFGIYVRILVFRELVTSCGGVSFLFSALRKLHDQIHQSNGLNLLMDQGIM